MSPERPFRRVRHIHMTGIGGAGMCGIAEVLLNRGFAVTGSDLAESAILDRLRGLGAVIHVGHSGDNVTGSDVVVYSSAVRPENVELRAARESRIPTIPRSEMLAELMRMKTGIAVAGTHGKTTTTSMIGAILNRAGLNPTLIVGGIVRSLDTGAQVGAGDFMVVEADEFDRSFLKLSPTIAVITTIEAEHLDTYGDLEGVKDAFVEFASKVPFYGSVVICGDDPQLQSVTNRIKRPLLSYGFGSDCQVRAESVSFDGTRSLFTVCRSETADAQIELQVPGHHNVLNALAAICVADELEVPREFVKTALAEFTGVRRRFEVRGIFDNVIIVDDYAHHPTEIENVLRTARISWPERRLVALFQPHLYSRTRDFYDEFGRVLALADEIMITEIYGAREQPIPGVSAELVAGAAREHGGKSVSVLSGPDLTHATISRLRAGDTLLIMGAGSITKVADELTRVLK